MSQHANVCRYFASTGNCYYGDQCNFAHIRPEGKEAPSPSSSGYKTKSQIPCRNKAQHGFCKFQGKGCEYNHDIPAKKDSDGGPALIKRAIGGREGSPALDEHGEGTHTSGAHSPFLLPSSNDRMFSLNEGVVNTPSDLTTNLSNLNLSDNTNNLAGHAPSPVPPNFAQMAKPSVKQGPPMSPVFGLNPTAANLQRTQIVRNSPDSFTKAISTKGGTTYFFDPDQQPQYNQPPPVLYNQGGAALPHTAKSGRRPFQSFFMSEDLRQDLLRRSSLILAVPQDNRYKDLPRTLQKYHSLYPLDDPLRPTNMNVFGYPTTVYKAISSVDGLPYAVRKIEGFRLSNEQAFRLGESWKKIQHPNLVTLSEIFISKDFGDVNSLFFAYDFHPASQTLESVYFAQMGDLIPESVLWSYITQLISAVRAVHHAGFALRCLVPSKILLTGKNRIRINCCGMQDVINFDGSKNSLLLYQREDLTNLGQLITALACRSMTAIQNFVKCLDFISNNYGPDLKSVILHLLKPGPNPIDEVCALLSNRFLMEVEHLHNYTDLLEADLTKELENGRLFRLLVKLGFINERPEFDMDPSWSETGDRYLLKLFRDYVFHQVYDDGTPVVDFAHVVESLNKLDVGVHEKIVLVSRDEQSVLVVSYKDLKRCTEEAFNELRTKKRPSQN